MAVQEQTPLQEYTANGITKQFDLEFDCESADHLIVSIDDLEVLHTDWYLSGSAIIFHVAPASGKQVKIQRNTPFNRLADYQSYNNSFRPPAINKDFDRIWWKLQELGVADWLMKLYVDRLHQQQEEKIDDLKGYVDDRDDELRAYLMEEIRKQGVALDQLDEYYNYLMQRLAQIAVDKGWDASFVTYNGQTQQKVNDGFSSITDMLSISNPKDGMRVFVKGSQGGWFEYNEARVLEDDGGTILNGWQRIDFDHITFDMFNCDNTGLTSIDDKLLKICAASTALKKPIHNFSGTYLIDSTNEFIFTENTLLDGTVFKLGSSFNGKFIAKRGDVENFIVNSGAGFNGLKALGVLQAGRYSINGSGFDYPDHYARFVNAQPLYIYRGDTKPALHFTRLLREQRIENAPYLAYDLSSLVEVNLQTPANSIRLYSGFCFDETLLNFSGDIRYFKIQDSNMVVCRNTRYIDNSEIRRNPNTTRMTAENCYNIVLDGETETSVFRNASDSYAYTLTLNLCYDVVVRNFRGLGAGGVSTGSNNCSRVTFEDSVLTRIDFHEPCYDWLKVKNCNVGSSGISVSMIGDLHIDGGELFMWESGASRAYVASRSDMGGFCYGDLYINNLKIGGYSGNNTVILEARGDGVLPAGSPLQPVFFNNVFINGLYNNSSYSNPSGLLSCDVPTTLLKPPKYIKVDTLTKFNPTINVGVFAARVSTDSVRIDLHNINHGAIWLQDLANKGTKLKVNITNANNNGGACQIVSTANADIDVVDTQLALYSEYNTAWTTFSPRIKIRGGSVLTDQYLALQSGADAKNRITMNAVGVDVPASAVNTMLPRARHMGCTFGSDGWITLWSSTPVVSTGSFTTSIYSGLLDLIVGWGTQKRIVQVDVRQAGTYNIEAGVTIVVTVSVTTATVTLNAAGANLLGVAGNL